MDGASITALVTLLTVILGFVVQIYRENRNRRWDLEDRKQLAAKVEDARHALSERVNASKIELSNLIAENTQISTNAFHEANTVNMKLEKLGLDHNAQNVKQTDAVNALTDAIRETKK